MRALSVMIAGLRVWCMKLIWRSGIRNQNASQELLLMLCCLCSVRDEEDKERDGGSTEMHAHQNFSSRVKSYFHKNPTPSSPSSTSILVSL